MTQCSYNSFYEVLVVFKYRHSYKECLRVLMQDPAMRELIRIRGSGAIMGFGGGSYVRFEVEGGLHGRGGRYSEILYESGLDEYYIYSELMPMLINYSPRECGPIVTHDTEPFDKELMEYLDGFKIIEEKS